MILKIYIKNTLLINYLDFCVPKTKAQVWTLNPSTKLYQI